MDWDLLLGELLRIHLSADDPHSQNHVIRSHAHSNYDFLIYGAPGKIRTPDPQIRSLVLYPAELPVQSRGCGWLVGLRLGETGI